MPHVRVVCPHDPSLLVTLGDRYACPELLARLIEEPRQLPRIASRQLAPPGHPDRFGRPGDQVGMLVLLTLALQSSRMRWCNG